MSTQWFSLLSLIPYIPRAVPALRTIPTVLDKGGNKNLQAEKKFHQWREEQQIKYKESVILRENYNGLKIRENNYKFSK